MVVYDLNVFLRRLAAYNMLVSLSSHFNTSEKEPSPIFCITLYSAKKGESNPTGFRGIILLVVNDEVILLYPVPVWKFAIPILSPPPFNKNGNEMSNRNVKIDSCQLGVYRENNRSLWRFFFS